MKRAAAAVAFLVAMVLTLAPGAQAKDDPVIISVWSDASELVIEGLALSRDEVTEPSVTLGDRILPVTVFSTTLVRALLPDPPLGAGTYLLTVDAGKDKVGTAEVTFSAADISCIGCVSESELDFDPATQEELDAEEAARIADVDGEEAARDAADVVLRVDLDAETAVRDADDEYLAQAIGLERQDRIAEDTALQSAIDALTARVEAIETPPNVPPGSKIVFVTSEEYNGNLGGLEGADANCQTLADAADLPGEYKAWLSDSTISARDRLTHWAGPYVRIDGTVVANDWIDLVTAKTDTGSVYYLRVAIRMDQNGYLDPPSSAEVWSSTFPDGTQAFIDGSEYYCADWMGDSEHGGVGEYEGVNASWTTSHTFIRPCSEEFHLYCFQQ